MRCLNSSGSLKPFGNALGYSCLVEQAGCSALRQPWGFSFSTIPQILLLPTADIYLWPAGLKGFPLCLQMASLGNPWKTLGVSEDADEKQIKKAYRKLALE